MKVNSEAIYATTASPLGVLPWGRCTQKEVNGKTVLYFSVFDWPKDGKLIISGLLQPVQSANLLNDNSLLKTKNTSTGLEISVPEEAPNEIASVIKVILKDKINSSGQGSKKKMKTGELD